MSRSHAFYVSKRRHLGDQEATLRIELSITWALCFVVRARLVVCIIHRWIMTNTGDVVLLSRSRFAAHGSPIFERSTAFRNGSYLDQAILALLKMFAGWQEMGDNIFTGNIFIKILVRFQGNSSSFWRRVLFCQDLLKRIIEIERSWTIFDLFRQRT